MTEPLQPEELEALTMTFEQHLSEIDRLAAADGVEGSYTGQTGADVWRDAYDGGATPAEAWAEEVSAGAQDVG